MLLEYFGDCGDFFSRIEEMSKDSLFLDFMANEEFDLTGRKSQIDCVRRIVTSEEISCGAVLVLKTHCLELVPEIVFGVEVGNIRFSAAFQDFCKDLFSSFCQIRR